MMKKYLAVIVEMTLLLSLAGCGASPEKEIDDLNRRFCRSYNHLDLDGVMDCLEPSLANTVGYFIDVSFGLMSSVVGIDIEIDAQTMYDLAKVCFDVMPEEDKAELVTPELDMELEDLEFSEDGSMAAGQVTVTLTADGMTQSSTGIIYYVLIDDEWFFANQNFQM